MSRLVIQGADRAPALPRCAYCGGGIPGSARVVAGGRKLAHPSCADRGGELERCSVCEALEPASSLDSSGRCGACQP